MMLTANELRASISRLLKAATEAAEDSPSLSAVIEAESQKLDALLTADIQTDNNGQLVIYTGIYAFFPDEEGESTGDICEACGAPTTFPLPDQSLTGSSKNSTPNIHKESYL